MDTNINTLVSIAILISCVCLLQIHGIAFWTAKVGVFGWGWSLLLEASALWLWYKPKLTYRLLALLVSFLTLAGPIHEVTSPIVVASHQVTNETIASNTILSNLKSEKARLENQLSTYQANSEKRTGWLAPIRSTNERIIEIDERIASLEINKPDDKKLYVNWVIVMEVAGLIIFQIVAVLTILSLSKVTNKPSKPTRKEQINPPEKTQSIEEIIVSDNISDICNLPEDDVNLEIVELEPLTILENVEVFLKRTGKNFREFSEYAGVSPKELSFLRNHEKRLVSGERTVSIKALEQIQKALNT